MTDLACQTCRAIISVCRCPDADERMRTVRDDGDVVLKWCPVCDRHFARCDCDDPLFVVVLNGKTLSEAGAFAMRATLADGRVVDIDLTAR